MIKSLTMLPATGEAQANDPTKKPTPSAEAAQQFEQIFLRKLLSQLMETTKLSGRSQVAGSGVYDSMVVDALATTMSASGGIGIAELIQKRLESHPEAARPLAELLPATGEDPAKRLDKVLRIHSSNDEQNRLFPTEATHLAPMALRRTR